MKKIVSLFLLLCILLSLSSVVLMAEESEPFEDSAVNDPLSKMDFVEASNGEYYNSEFSRFIDVEKYVINAGTVGYDKLVFVGVEEYYKTRDPLLVFYVFNPENIQFYVNTEIEDLNYSCCYIDMFDSYGASVTALGAIEQPTEGDMSPMFFRLVVPTLTGDYGLPDVPDDGSDRSYAISNIRFTDGVGISFYDVALMQTMTFSGLDAEKKCTFSNVSSDVFRNTSPWLDLLFFFSESYSESDELKLLFPEDKSKSFDVAYLYESGYGSDKYSLYLYLYNPAKSIITGDIYVNMFNPVSTLWEVFTFREVKNEGTMSKYICTTDLSDFNNKTYRDYIISNISINYRSEGTSSSSSPSSIYLDDYLRYEYSDYSLDNFVSSTFRYDTTLYFDAVVGDEIFISADDTLVSWINADIYDLDFYEVVSSSDTYLQLKVARQLSEGKCSLPIMLYTQFPLYENDIYVNYGVNGDFNLYSFKASDLTKVVSSGYSLDLLSSLTNEKKSLYMRGERNGTVHIEAQPTYYRLNSSSSGEYYYQTLSSIYFDIPYEMLTQDLSEGFFGNGFVSAIELYYESVMCQPGLVVEAGSRIEEIANRIISGDFDKNGTAIYSNMKTDYTVDVTLHSASDFCFGKECDDVATFDGIWVFEYIPYLIVSDAWNDYDEVYSSEEMTALIESEQKFMPKTFDTHQSVFRFDQDMILSGFKDMSFTEQKEILGWFKAILWNFGFLESNVEDSMSFKAIETLYGSELDEAYRLNDIDLFCDTYAVAKSDYIAVKDKMLHCLNNNRAFVFLRFDIYDYYCSSPGYFTDDGILKTEYFSKCDDALVFQTKYYKDIDFLTLQVSDFIGNTKLYDVVMQPINFSAGITDNPSVDDLIQDPSDAIGNSFNALFTGEGDKSLAIITSLIILFVIVIVLTIFFPGVMMPLINGFISFIAKGFSFAFNLGGQAVKSVSNLFKKE